MESVADPRGERILLVTFFAPSRGHAGGLRLLELYRQLRRLRPNAYLCLLTFVHQDVDWGEESLAQIFDEVLRRPKSEFGALIFERTGLAGQPFDLVDFQFHQCGALIPAARRIWPRALMLFSPMESQIRACMIYFLNGVRPQLRNVRLAAGLARNAVWEWIYLRRADRVLAVSSADQEVLRRCAGHRVVCVPTGIDVEDLGRLDAPSDASSPPTIVCLAYWGSRTNQEALTWFCQQVHPRIRSAVKGYRLRVVGRGLAPELVAKCDVGEVVFAGSAATIGEAVQGATLGIAPALSGAGVRGKVHQYAAFGIPCVASPLAVEGLRYEHGISVLLAADAAAFASACIDLLTDAERRLQVGARAREVCLAHYSWTSLEAEITAAYQFSPLNAA